MNKKIYHIFDVDGTITPARKPIEKDFLPIFYNFCLENNVVLATGSDEQLIMEQLPPELLSLVKLYTCSGVEGLENIKVDTEIENPFLITKLEEILKKCYYPDKTGKHINLRKGMINFSVVGRNANDQQRKEYYEFDKVHNQRKWILNELSHYKEYDICIGGETSIDITKKGINKSLVAKDILAKENDVYFIFYGNQILDGNDFYLAKYIKDQEIGHSIQIEYKDLKLLLDKMWSV
jgi:phosphomannomutase